MVYVTDRPAEVERSEGEDDSLKSAKKIARERVAVWFSFSLVPLTVKLRGLAVDAVSPATVTVLLSPRSIDEGSKEQVAPEQESEMLSVKVLGATAVMVKVVSVLPIRIIFEGLGTVREKMAVPVPLRETDCGLPSALSVRVRVPVRVPVAVGVKLTLMVQLAPTDRVFGQVCVSTKSPLAEISSMVRSMSPLLVSVTVLARLVVSIV